jgi:hypothetical protein
MSRKRYSFFEDEAGVDSNDNDSSDDSLSSTVDDDDDDDEDFSTEEPKPPLKRKRLVKNSEKCAPAASVPSAVTAAVTPKRGRPKGTFCTCINTYAIKLTKGGYKTGAAALAPVTEKLPGDPSYPINNFSLTVTKTGSDISLDCLEIVDAFIKEYCLKGLVSTEVGTKKFQLHLQATLRMHYPKTKDMVTKLSKMIRGQLPNNGKGHKVRLNALLVLV